MDEFQKKKEKFHRMGRRRIFLLTDLTRGSIQGKG